MIRLVCLKALVILFIPVCSMADKPRDKQEYRNLPVLKNCLFYRAKRKEVPVFAEPSTSAQVLDRLSLGEEICYVGETSGFAILDWEKQQLIRGSSEVDKDSVTDIPKRAYVRLVELWEPKYSATKSNYFGKVFDTLFNRNSGTVPEDPLAPYRPIVEELKGGSDVGGQGQNECPK